MDPLATATSRSIRPSVQHLPPARGPSTVRARARAEAPVVDADHVVSMLLNLFVAVVCATVPDVLRALASEAYWYLVTHPSVIGTWIGVELSRSTVFLLAGERDLQAFARGDVYVNAPSQVELLSHDHPEAMATVTTQALAAFARSIDGTELLRLAVDGAEGETWAIRVEAGAVLEAIAVLETRGVDMTAQVYAYPRPDPIGEPELVIDGHGWIVTVESSEPGAPIGLRVSLPLAPDGVSAVERAAAPVWQTMTVGEVG